MPTDDIIPTTPPRPNSEQYNIAPSEISIEPVCSLCSEIFKPRCATFVVHADSPDQIIISRRDREFGIAQQADPEILTMCSLCCLLVYVLAYYRDDPGSIPMPIKGVPA